MIFLDPGGKQEPARVPLIFRRPRLESVQGTEMALELTGFGVTFLDQSQTLTGLISREQGLLWQLQAKVRSWGSWVGEGLIRALLELRVQCLVFQAVSVLTLEKSSHFPKVAPPLLESSPSATLKLSLSPHLFLCPAVCTQRPRLQGSKSLATSPQQLPLLPLFLARPKLSPWTPLIF